MKGGGGEEGGSWVRLGWGWGLLVGEVGGLKGGVGVGVLWRERWGGIEGGEGFVGGGGGWWCG